MDNFIETVPFEIISIWISCLWFVFYGMNNITYKIRAVIQSEMSYHQKAFATIMDGVMVLTFIWQCMT